jgi:hypothetical protein
MSAHTHLRATCWQGPPWYERDRARLLLEVRVMQTRFPNFTLKQDEDQHLMWVGTLTPTDTSYQIALVYPDSFPDEAPKVFPVEPEIMVFQDPKIGLLQHQFSDRSLCLFHPNDRFFETNTTAVTFIAKAATWLAAYEMWRENGVWPGVETKH